MLDSDDSLTMISVHKELACVSSLGIWMRQSLSIPLSLATAAPGEFSTGMSVT
jgi:hypothetical protein